MTHEQQQAAIAIYPLAHKWARRFSQDDEYQSLAGLLVCKCVIAYRPEWGVSLKTYVFRELRLAMHRERDKSMRMLRGLI